MFERIVLVAPVRVPPAAVVNSCLVAHVQDAVGLAQDCVEYVAGHRCDQRILAAQETVSLYRLAKLHAVVGDEQAEVAGDLIEGLMELRVVPETVKAHADVA
jgi:hypothetical protein